MASKAVYAGSFDPVTIGHMNVIEQAAKAFDEVVVLVATNTEKSGNYMFSTDERLEMVRVATAHFGNVTADILHSGYTMHYAERIGATALIRGIRDESDFELESKIFTFNHRVNPNIPTVFLMPGPSVAHVSSSFVKQNCYGIEGWLDIADKYVPPTAIRYLARKYIEEACGCWVDTHIQYPKLWEAYDRPYHNEEHLVRMHDELYGYLRHRYADRPRRQILHYVSDMGTEGTAYCLAIMYHDYFVESDTDDNGKMIGVKAQAESAKVFSEQTRSIENSYITDTVIDLITASQHGESSDNKYLRESSERCTLPFLDADLAILGAPPARYARYAQGIREEYLAAGIPEADFIKARHDFLRQMLTKDHIFHTEYFRNKYELAAERNIADELDQLQSAL